MEMTAALALGRRLLREHGLEEWTMRSDRAKTRAGVCRFGPREISLSIPLTRLHDEAAVRDTILHEIAHALVGPSHGHDEVWRRTAREIGCSGERLVASDLPHVEGPWRGECPRGHVVTRHRRPQRVQSCARCNRTFDPRALLTWTFEGRRVAMGQAYRDELDTLIGRSPAASRPSFSIGAVVRVTAPGPLHGEVGEVEATFAARCQVRVGDELYAVPHDALEPADRLAS